MPQDPWANLPDKQPKQFDFSGLPDQAPSKSPDQMSDLERLVVGLPPKQTSWFDEVASYIPQPVKSAWNTVWEPTTDITSRAGKAVSDYLDPTQYGTYDPRRYLAAYPEAVGNVLTGLTSPGNLALTAATGGAALAGKTGVQAALPVVAPKVAQGLTTAGRAIGGATALHGAQTIVDPSTSMLEKGMGVLEAVGGGLAARAPRPKAAPIAGVADELPVPPKAAPIEAPPKAPITEPVVPGSEAAVQLVDELDAAKKAGYTVMPANSPALQTPTFQKYPVVGTLSDGSVVIDARPPAAKAATATKSPQVQAFEADVLGGKGPNLDADLSRMTPEELAEMNKFMETGPPAMTPEVAAAEMAKPPTTDVRAFLDSMNQPEVPAVTPRKATLEMEGGKTVELEFLDPSTGEIVPASQARPGSIPLPVSETPTAVPGRRAGSRMGAPNMGLPEAPVKTPMERLQALTPEQQQGVNNLMAEGMSSEDALAAMEQGKRAVSVTPEPALAEVGFSKPPEVKGQVGGETAGPATAADRPKLPTQLQGAKPRFNIGADSYFPQFQDDLDKALYIIGQTKKSKQDASYLKWVMEQTGLSEVEARNAGAQIKAAIKEAVQGKETGNVTIPSIMRERLAAKGGGGAGKPPTKPPVATGGEPPTPPKQTPKEFLEGKPQVDTGPIVPENAGVTTSSQEVVQSLSTRLQKAVDNAGTPNAVAAEDISALLDDLNDAVAKMPNGPEKSGLIRQVLGANKALLTSWDLSAPGRQGKAFILNKAWWTSLDDMVRAWKSPEAAKLIAQSIDEHPSGYFTKPISESGKVGKSFAEKVGLDLSATEEVFNSVIERAAGKIPLVQRSSRAHTAFLNKLRSDQFVSMMDKAKKAGLNPEQNLELAKAYAKFINDATGRGSVNIGKWKLERNIGVLNDVFFAPKNMAGQIRTWNQVLNPVKYYNYDPVMRKQALRSLMAVAGLGSGVATLAGLAGADVGTNPTSSDFGKIKVGDTRIDMFGGYQQFPVAAMKLISGISTPTTGKNAGQMQDLTTGRIGQNRETVAERFFTNRLSPAGSFIYSWLSGREFDGKPFEWKKAMYERVFPIAAKDLLELAQEDPALAAMLGPTTLMGLTGTQTYAGR